MKNKEDFHAIIDALERSSRILLLTHKDPDADGVGSMLALARALSDRGKKTSCIAEAPLPGSLVMLRDAEMVSFNGCGHIAFDATVALDCSSRDRMAGCRGKLPRPLINIDHHDTNDGFGDLNLVEKGSSSTGEIVFHLIRAAGLPMGYACAENLFAAIQSDTGSFRYTNTTVSCLQAAMELIGMGVRPWDVALRVMDGCSPARLELLRMALETLTFYSRGRIGLMTVSLDMFRKSGADFRESERFVDYPRSVRGVQIAALVRETAQDYFKFSLRSNTDFNVAELAVLFGGGGHNKAAAFESRGPLDEILKAFLNKAERLLDRFNERRDSSD